MLEIVSWFVIALITHILDCYVFCKLIKQKFHFNRKILFVILFLSFIDYIIGFNHTGILKLLVTNLITFLLLKIIYDKSISKTLIATLFIYLGYVLAEAFYAIFVLVIFNIPEDIIFNNFLGNLISNIIIFLCFYSIFSMSFINNLLCKIINWCDEKKVINTINLTLLSLMLCTVLVYQVSYKSFDSKVLIFFSFLVLISVITLIGGYFKEKSGNNKLNIEYAQLLEYVKTYEDEVVDKSKKQHEYRNQLIIIDNLIPKTNKKAKEYLKKVLNNVEDVTDNDWLVKLKNLPSGGIKGLIHFKIKKMLDKKISVFVYVDKKLSKKEIWFNIEKNLEDISRILGVYLDNAIEASEKSVDKQIIIEFVNNKEDIEFILSNSYDGNINFAELDKEGYSTKGKGRGVGLSLVKDIINNNNILTQSREINGKFFVQKLYIKNKI